MVFTLIQIHSRILSDLTYTIWLNPWNRRVYWGRLQSRDMGNIYFMTVWRIGGQWGPDREQSGSQLCFSCRMLARCMLSMSQPFFTTSQCFNATSKTVQHYSSYLGSLIQVEIGGICYKKVYRNWLHRIWHFSYKLYSRFRSTNLNLIKVFHYELLREEERIKKKRNIWMLIHGFSR